MTLLSTYFHLSQLRPIPIFNPWHFHQQRSSLQLLISILLLSLFPYPIQHQPTSSIASTTPTPILKHHSLFNQSNSLFNNLSPSPSILFQLIYSILSNPHSQQPLNLHSFHQSAIHISSLSIHPTPTPFRPSSFHLNSPSSNQPILRSSYSIPPLPNHTLLPHPLHFIQPSTPLQTILPFPFITTTPISTKRTPLPTQITSPFFTGWMEGSRTLLFPPIHASTINHPINHLPMLPWLHKNQHPPPIAINQLSHRLWNCLLISPTHHPSPISHSSQPCWTVWQVEDWEAVETTLQTHSSHHIHTHTIHVRWLRDHSNGRRSPFSSPNHSRESHGGWCGWSEEDLTGSLGTDINNEHTTWVRSIDLAEWCWRRGGGVVWEWDGPFCGSCSIHIHLSESPYQPMSSNTSILHAEDDWLGIHLYQRRIRYHWLFIPCPQWRWWSVNKSMTPFLPTSKDAFTSTNHHHSLHGDSHPHCCEVLLGPSPQTDDEGCLTPLTISGSPRLGGESVTWQWSGYSLDVQWRQSPSSPCVERLEQLHHPTLRLVQ